MKTAKAAAAPAAAMKEASLFWLSAAAPVVAAAVDAAALEEDDSWVLKACVPETVVVAPVLFAAAEPVVVGDAVAVLLPVEALDASDEQATVLGRSVTPPRAQMDLAALRVSVARSWSGLGHKVLDGHTYSPGLPWSIYRRHSK